jgi:hypothetical protein
MPRPRRATADGWRDRLESDPRPRGEAAPQMGDLPRLARGLLVRDFKGKEADRPVTRIDPGVVSLLAELRGHERHAADELE